MSLRIGTVPTLSAVDLERFWARVAIGPGIWDCWLWTGARRSTHGAMRVAGRPVYVHRISFVIHHGPLPYGYLVRHRCDTPLCVRPDHLEAGTVADNVRDMWERGQAVPPPRMIGLAHPKATIPDDVITSAIAAVASGESQRDVAARVGVSQSTIWRWLHGETRAAA